MLARSTAFTAMALSLALCTPALGIGGYGVSKTRAWGGVYNLKTLDDFTGTYVMLRSGVAAGEKDVGNKRLVVKRGGSPADTSGRTNR